MRGISAEGLAVSTERLESVAAAGDAERLGAELFSVADLVSREGSLRRAMTDPSASSAAKTGLARTVLNGKVADPTVEVVATAAGAKWSSTSDFVHALEQLGALALVISAERADQLSDLEDELFRFGRVVAGNPQLRDALTNKHAPVAHRQALVSSLLEGKATKPAIRLAVQAVGSRDHSFETALEDYQDLAAKRQESVIALVRTAIALNEQERARLADVLSRQYGRNIHLNVVVDPAILGGIKVELGDDVIDGSVAGRLDDARRRMVG
ncbi:MAG: F0F1 ATP synthase subunit delta [Nocardioidaceae bacterium]|nr:F0F1 ATP synthase subunit delta [Nocardioidaceae bacterium]